MPWDVWGRVSVCGSRGGPLASVRVPFTARVRPASQWSVPLPQLWSEVRLAPRQLDLTCVLGGRDMRIQDRALLLCQVTSLHLSKATLLCPCHLVRNRMGAEAGRRHDLGLRQVESKFRKMGRMQESLRKSTPHHILRGHLCYHFPLFPSYESICLMSLDSLL